MRAVYKYLAPERIGDLATRTLRFSQPGALNDPAEMTPYFYSVIPDGLAEEKLRDDYPEVVRQGYDQLPAEVRARLPLEEYKTHMLSPERNLAARFDQQQRARAEYATSIHQQVLDQQTAVLSLTDDPSNLLMWSYYSDGHTGFVLGFDRLHQFFSADGNIGGLLPVEYTEIKPETTMWDATNEQIFLTKSVHWSHEREWRMFASLDSLKDAGKEDRRGYSVLVAEYPPDALRYAVVGSRAAADVREALIRAVATGSDLAHVALFEAKVSARRFGLTFQRVAI